MSKIVGIYKIENKINGMVYVGSSINVIERLAQHRRDLKREAHCNQKLQRSYLKYGEDQFLFQCIEVVIFIEALTEREQFWIDYYRSVGRVYNLCPAAGSCAGFKHSEITLQKRKKIIPWNKGVKGYKTKPASEERKRRVASAQMGELNHNFGKPTPDSVKEKIRSSLNGSKCYLAKLDERQVMDIKIALMAGEKGNVLAAKYGVAKTQISSIKNGKTWRHVVIDKPAI